MVSFICDECQTTLKKAKVQNHSWNCSSHSYSCIDCSQTFDYQTVQSHSECISEAEKYEKALYKGKKKQNNKNNNNNNNNKQSDNNQNNQQTSENTSSNTSDNKSLQHDKINKKRKHENIEKQDIIQYETKENENETTKSSKSLTSTSLSTSTSTSSDSSSETTELNEMVQNILSSNSTGITLKKLKKSVIKQLKSSKTNDEKLDKKEILKQIVNMLPLYENNITIVWNK